MINTTSVGLVFVGGSGQFEITNDEKTYIMAQVEQGLEELANNEPNANMSWTFSTLSVNINNITPWEGANWKGLPDDFYKGIDEQCTITKMIGYTSLKEANLYGLRTILLMRVPI